MQRENRGNEKIQKQMNRYLNKVKELTDYVTNHPEISGEEKNTCGYLVGFLSEQGYEVTAPYAKMPHSFLAVPKEHSGEQTRKAALLCEYDALPEVGHACGHSLSCGCSILAALALRGAFPGLPLRVDLIGTPGEEFVGGKAIMAENGAFDDYEFAAMIHMSNEDVTAFRVLASNDRYITFHGKASHASNAPQDGLNALNAARLFMDAMDMWRQHVPSDCQLHGIVDKGGTAPNIVPDQVSLDYYFRAETMEHLYLLNEKAALCAEGAAIATGTTFELQQRYPDYGDIYWNGDMNQLMTDLFAITGRQASSPGAPGGSSDAGNVSMRIPVFHPMLDITRGHKEIVLHDKAFEALLHTDEALRGLRDGACILAHLIYRLASDEALLRNIQDAHRAYRKLPGS